MAEKYRGRNGTAEGHEIGCNVIHRRNESSVEDVRNRNHEAAREGDRQQDGHHDVEVCSIV